MSKEPRKELSEKERIAYVMWAFIQQYQKPTFKQGGIPCAVVHKNEVIINKR